MPRRQIATFAESDQTYIALLQPTVLNVPMTLQPANVPEGSIGFPQYERTIELVTLEDFSAVNFVIVGVNLAGTRITEVLAGPNDGIVSSTLRYHYIISITPDTTKNELICVGSSDAAVTADGINAVAVSQWLSVDNFIPYYSVTIQAVCSDTPTIDYTIDSTCTELQTPQYGSMTVNTPVATSLISGETTTTVTSTTKVVSAYRITVSTATSTRLTTTFLQQGLK